MTSAESKNVLKVWYQRIASNTNRRYEQIQMLAII